MKKERIDVLLLEKGLFTSRERAHAALLAGRVLVNEQKIDKAGSQVPLDASIRVTGEDLPYVSRGGLKLAKALEAFRLCLTGKVVADVGASTGGFTDCALQNGAGKVYAIDVGYGQLAWKLRGDSRVVNMERTNARYLCREQLAEAADVITVDVAFISLDKIFSAIVRLLAPDGRIVALVKPQFEAGRENIGKKGVVRDPLVHTAVLEKIIKEAASNDLAVLGLTYSPIRGPEGNIEYLIYLGPKTNNKDVAYSIETVVKKAHEKTV